MDLCSLLVVSCTFWYILSDSFPLILSFFVTFCDIFTFDEKGYMIHAAKIPEDYEEYYYYYWDDDEEMDEYPDAEYLVGRGIFVGFHAMFLGYLYLTNGRFPKCMHGRKSLIRFWILLQLIFCVLVLYFVLDTDWWWIMMLAYMACSPFIMNGALLLSCFLLKKQDEAGGCNCAATLSLMIVISWYFSLVFFVAYIVIMRMDEWYAVDYDEPEV